MGLQNKNQGWRFLVLPAGLSFMAAGLAIILWNWTKIWGQDFGPIYLLAKALFRGYNIYAPNALRLWWPRYVGPSLSDMAYPDFYPPSTGAALFFVGLLPFRAASLLFILVDYAVLVYGVWRLTVAFAPEWDARYRILAIGLTVCAGSVRWGFGLLQVAPLMLGLLAVFVGALTGSRPHIVEALIAGALILLVKPTFGLPILGLPILQRRFKFLVVMLGIWALINGLGFARLGGMAAAKDYISGVAGIYNKRGNSTNPYVIGSFFRIDWPALARGVGVRLKQVKVVCDALFILCILGLFWEMRRSEGFALEPATTGAFLAPLVCLTLLGVYHHDYDAGFLLAPLIVYISSAKEYWKLSGVKLFTVLVIWYAGIYMPGKVPALLHALGVGRNIIVYYEGMQGTIVITLALIASFWALHAYVSAKARGKAPLAHARGSYARV